MLQSLDRATLSKHRDPFQDQNEYTKCSNTRHRVELIEHKHLKNKRDGFCTCKTVYSKIVWVSGKHYFQCCILLNLNSMHLINYCKSYAKYDLYLKIFWGSKLSNG